MGTFRNNILVKPESYIIFAFALLVLSPQWVAAWLVASVVHELCHFITLKVFGVDVYSVTVGVGGAVMETGPMSNLAEGLSALSGPLGAILLIFSARYFPRLAVCCFFQSAFNIIPVYPLDGGRVMRCILRLFCSGKRMVKIANATETAVLFLLFLAAVYFAVCYRLGVCLLVLPVAVCMKRKILKSPCKRSKQIVQ